MRTHTPPARLFALTILMAVLIAACDSSHTAPAASTPTASTPASPGSPAHVSTGAAGDWPLFGFDAQRTNDSAAAGITAANLGKLARQRVSLPGTVDSSPIYLNGVTIHG